MKCRQDKYCTYAMFIDMIFTFLDINSPEIERLLFCVGFFFFVIGIAVNSDELIIHTATCCIGVYASFYFLNFPIVLF